MVREIYNNTIREIFKEYFEGDVSKECIICIKECLMFILEKIIKEIIDEYHIDNVNKGKYGLRKSKRISKEVANNVINKLYKEIDIFYEREVGQHNRDTTFTKADVEVV